MIIIMCPVSASLSHIQRPSISLFLGTFIFDSILYNSIYYYHLTLAFYPYFNHSPNSHQETISISQVFGFSISNSDSDNEYIHATRSICIAHKSPILIPHHDVKYKPDNGKV